ncbi:hypothetical protein C731_2994 [Mycolicibacterium hassiacum DSM 44199]|uniref:Uncharacterized protein n=1 Tax=Mycolicibacterium hassiacum (strain DSM 44199 / CIP 105218 / JCM 12690 / 3849) TaxID=1122247 RepID=K5BFA6_MYCHD|nr:hypothetical protein C731_2994 [Mycolicibacterium hassiacum DSM 44199]
MAHVPEVGDLHRADHLDRLGRVLVDVPANPLFVSLSDWASRAHCSPPGWNGHLARLSTPRVAFWWSLPPGS